MMDTNHLGSYLCNKSIFTNYGTVKLKLVIESKCLQANDDGVLSNARSRLSLNLSFIGQKAMQ